MQVPERLALIGGSILLASTLVFTLKSQASSIIPKVGHSISGVFNHISDKSNDFDNGYQEAQKKGWTTGQWGTAKYYIDKDMNMRIGTGILQGKLYDLLGDSTVHQLKTINIDQAVTAPADSTQLFSGANDFYNNENNSITYINGLNNVDTSQVTNMSGIFANNRSEKSLDLSHWDTHNVTDLSYAFHMNHDLSSLNVDNWDTSNVSSLGCMFGDNFSLTSLNLSSWNTAKVNDMKYMFNNDHSLTQLNISKFDMSASPNKSQMLGQLFGMKSDLNSLTLGSNTNISGSDMPASNWEQNGHTISNEQLNNDHPGTWFKQ